MTGIKLLTLVVLLAVLGDALCRIVPVKRAQLLGGYATVDDNEPSIKTIAEYAVNTIEKMTGSLFQYELEKIVSAQKQIVTGSNYNVTFIMSVSSCRPRGYVNLLLGSAPSTSPCSVTSYSECNALVFEQKRGNALVQRLSYTCAPSTYTKPKEPEVKTN